jgi:hypothetical protein
MWRESTTADGAGRRRFVLVGNPGSPRIDLFNSALARQGQPAAVLIPWLEWIENRRHLPDVIRPGDVLRIESPGRDFATERAILAWGSDPAEADGCAALSRDEVSALAFDKGRILCSRQWYLGFRLLLDRLKCELEAIDDLVLMNDCDEIAVMFDKPACHAAMTAAGIPVPPLLGQPSCYDDLMAWMIEKHCLRVFVKLAHGSSGSGIVAYQTDGRRHLGWTTVETVMQSGGVELYNTRKLQRLTSQNDIARLIDALCGHRVHAERWIPKAGMEGKNFDLRVVVIAGAPAHAIARLSATPVTNLHLLNQRRSAAHARAHIGEAAWDRAMKTCAAAMQIFPKSLYAGVDLLITPDFKRHAVLEINAFGDQLPGVLHRGLDTYDAEIRAARAGWGVKEAVA